MIIQLYDFNTGVRTPHVVPDGPIEDFIRFILETRSWRDYPDRALDKLFRLRKTLLEAAEPIEPEPVVPPLDPEVEPEMAVAVAPSEMRAGPRAPRRRSR